MKKTSAQTTPDIRADSENFGKGFQLVHTVEANTLHPSERYVLFSTLNDFAVMTGFHSTCNNSENATKK